MRDVALTTLILCCLPYILRHPWFGTLLWAWVSVMSPHRLTFGFAYDMPWAVIVGVTTLIGFLITPDHKKLPASGITALLFLLPIWMTITTLFALVPTAWEMWDKVIKVFLMLVITLALLHTRRHIELLVWITVGSIAFYGVKGGLFTLTMGGEERVYGPVGSFIEENNSLALAVVMCIPLLNYIRLTVANKWVRWSMLPCMLLCGLSVLGSHSRGGFLAVGAMLLFLWWRGKNKFFGAIVIVAAAITLPLVMHEKWETRMNTIEEYETDSSAQGRLNAWAMALNLVKDRPIVGGGFDMYEPAVFLRWAPNPEDIHSSHSIYFQMLGEHGFPGFFLYLLLGALTWTTAAWIRRNTSPQGEYRWAYWFASMSQVSFVGFAVGGTFLNLAYFDATYNFIVALVLTKALIEREKASAKSRVQGTPRGQVLPRPAEATK